ncbi:hypothetical protein GCM10011369_18640 [Neiella marina]|uniref:HNH nuclease domain-containing protein n=1 Tax=Neiella marina TaxID=508461 RepID=A0A8J2XP37_9GAMM|nr:HNH endonuclease [Neiella marina]GGA77008.1 hypothetical protein GCM10011369_18640 [Neiella marina]
MYRVTYYLKSSSYRSRSYSSENGALKAIWKWLREKPEADHAICLFPECEPRTIDDWRELPFVEPKPKADFYSSTKWLRIRALALEKYGARCACCGATPADGVRMHVDHIKPRSIHPDLELELENLQVLCEACNLGKSNLSEKQWRD